VGLCRTGGGDPASVDLCGIRQLTFLRFPVRFPFFLQYYAGHEIFLDGSNVVFVVVVRLDVGPDERARELRYWLRFIRGRMCEQPGKDSRPAVLLVGSHRDAADTDVKLVKGAGGKEWTSAWGNEQLLSVSQRVCRLAGYM
jgi:hypothetical protein